MDSNRVGTYLLYVSLFFAVTSAWKYFGDFVAAVYRAPGAKPEQPAAPRRRAGTPRAPRMTRVRGAHIP
jgi:CDP-diacylglycerol---glycerol-3-phosphate 3-phosphatidyltransferase